MLSFYHTKMRALIGASEKSTFGRAADYATAYVSSGVIKYPGQNPLLVELYEQTQMREKVTGNKFDTREGVERADEHFVYWSRVLESLVPQYGQEHNVQVRDIQQWIWTLRQQQILPEEVIALIPFFREAAQQTLAPVIEEGQAGAEVPSPLVGINIMSRGVEIALKNVITAVEEEGGLFAQNAIKDARIAAPPQILSLQVNSLTTKLSELEKDPPFIALLRAAIYDELIGQLPKDIKAATQTSSNTLQ